MSTTVVETNAIVEPTVAEPVTVVVSRHVREIDRAAFTSWTEEAIAAAELFPGFLGAGVLHPGTAGDDHHLIYRFATPQTLTAWESSAERAALLLALEPLVLADRAHRVSGLETWFALPGNRSLVPPRWKQALLTLLAVYPLQLLSGLLLAPHVKPLVLRVAVSAVLLVVFMTWLVMPPLSRLVRGWLYRS